MKHPLAILLICTSLVLSPRIAAQSFKVLANDGSPVADAVISAGPRVSGPAPVRAVMDQVDKAFTPYVLPVRPGTEIDFPNSDQIRHHVYSFSPAKPFELRLYSGVPEAPVEFDQAGVVVVGCNIHDNMVGYIFVSPREQWAKTDASGVAELDVTEEQVFVWHPALSLDAQREISFKLGELEKTGEHYQVRLDIPPPPAFPQAVKTRDRDRFKRFLD